MVVSKTKHSKTKHPRLKNEASKTRKRSTQDSKTKHPKLETCLSFKNTRQSLVKSPMLTQQKSSPITNRMQFKTIQVELSLRRRRSKPSVYSVCELVHNIVFESRRVAKKYVGVIDWLFSFAVCD